MILVGWLRKRFLKAHALRLLLLLALLATQKRLFN